MKLDILVLTMPTRKEFLARLVCILQPQIDYKNASVLYRICDPKYTLGENRDMLRRCSQGEYIVFIDDDDVVPSDYVSTILPLLDGVDYIGYDVQCSIDGKMMPVTHHSLQYAGWYEDENGFYRDISHINPMRRVLALLEPMEGGHGEDKRWADRMRARSVLKAEHYIPRVMYEYQFRSEKHYTETCPKCGSKSVVRLEFHNFCNRCSFTFGPIQESRKSCLWP